MVNWSPADLIALGKRRAAKPSAPLAHTVTAATILTASIAAPGKRLRQSAKPLLNKLEAEWLWHLKAVMPGVTIRAQAKQFRLAHGSQYRPDFTALVGGAEHAWEVKGGKGMKGVSKGVMTVKLFAHEWPEIAVYFCWKERGKWLQQRVLP